MRNEYAPLGSGGPAQYHLILGRLTSIEEFLVHPRHHAEASQRPTILEILRLHCCPFLRTREDNLRGRWRLPEPFCPLVSSYSVGNILLRDQRCDQASVH